MPRQPLDILAIEPFYGGGRRLMLETLQRHSEHRWTVLRLPGRRIERRLEAAAQWFAEVLLRRPIFDFDVLFTSEAINLPELYQLCPELGGHPSVVYFHDNQLPHPGSGVSRPIDHVNLLTALEASEIWFNSLYHMRSVMGRAAAVTRQLPHYFDGEALARITSRSTLVPPPVDLEVVGRLLNETAGAPDGGGAGSVGADGGEAGSGLAMSARSVFVDVRSADVKLLAATLELLHQREPDVRVIALAPHGRLPEKLAQVTLTDYDEASATTEMLRCGTYLSAGADATFDARAVMAMAAGMRVVLPDAACYPELVPSARHAQSLYPPRPECLASAVQETWAAPVIEIPNLTADPELLRFDARTVVPALDERISSLADAFRVHTAERPKGNGGAGGVGGAGGLK